MSRGVRFKAPASWCCDSADADAYAPQTRRQARLGDRSVVLAATRSTEKHCGPEEFLRGRSDVGKQKEDKIKLTHDQKSGELGALA